MNAPVIQTVELKFTPFAHQRLAHTLRLAVRFLVLVWHRRAGKTVFAVIELLLAAASCQLERGRYGYIAPQLKQAKGVAWDYLQRFSRDIPGAIINQSELSIELPNGARVRLFGADNPDSFRGLYFDGVVIDEVADIKPNLWGEIIRPALTDRKGWAIFIGTSKGVNLFSELYYRALKEAAAGEWGADMRRASETGVLTDEELAAARREMSDPQYAQEFDCDFAAAVDDVLLRLDAVLAAQKRTAAVSEYNFAPKVLGVDVARYGGDRTVLFPRQGIVAFKPTIIKKADTMTVAAAVAHVITTWKPDGVFIDAGGMGVGVIDRLLQLKHRVIPVNFGGSPTHPRFENKRAEMWWDMAEWVKGACLPGLQELAQDLTAPRFTYANAKGKLQLESKDDLRARGLPSPDVGDALACTFAAQVAPTDPYAVEKPNDYHPLEEYR